MQRYSCLSDSRAVQSKKMLRRYKETSNNFFATIVSLSKYYTDYLCRDTIENKDY